MNTNRTRLWVWAWPALLFSAACSRPLRTTPPQYQEAESLLGIVAEFQRYRHADLYRFPYPRDLSGQNVFKATLVRLSNYQTLYPNRYGELIAFTRGEAYTRLAEYSTAIRFCEEAAAAGGELQKRAAENAQRLKEFVQATALPSEAQSLSQFQKGLEERIERCRQLAERYDKTRPWGTLSWCEYEQAEADLAEFLWANRQVTRGGAERAVERLEAIRKRHSESKNVYQHTLRLGDWHLELATEYATLFPPERSMFDWENFERWTARAKSLYLEVAQSFGADERTEAAGKLAALEALEHRIRNENR